MLYIDFRSTGIIRLVHIELHGNWPETLEVLLPDEDGDVPFGPIISKIPVKPSPDKAVLDALSVLVGPEIVYYADGLAGVGLHEGALVRVTNPFGRVSLDGNFLSGNHIAEGNPRQGQSGDAGRTNEEHYKKGEYFQVFLFSHGSFRWWSDLEEFHDFIQISAGGSGGFIGAVSNGDDRHDGL